MSRREVEILAIGAGPSNLALAVALEELAPEDVARNTLLIEQNDSVVWQPGMLLPWTQSQVSFLKDLVTVRNPVSRFSFINFLHSNNKLNEFINLGTFTPYRREISDYLNWVARSLSLVNIEYGRQVTSTQAVLDENGTPQRWLVELSDGSSISCRYLVVGAGRDAHIPEVLSTVDRRRLIHSTEFLQGLEALKDAPRKVLVIGGAQSAAEMLWTAYNRFPEADCTMVMRSIGLSVYDGSKFTNELFYPTFTSDFHSALPEAREQMLTEMHRSNYAGLAPSLLDSLYRRMYEEKLAGTQRLRMLTMHDITEARDEGDGVVLTVRDRKTGRSTELEGDVVLLGTGFDRSMPKLVRGLAATLGTEEISVTRNYQLETPASGGAACYLQGVNEATHGISDSLLSVLASRAGEIVQDILGHLADDAQLVPDSTEENRSWNYAA